ncbi:unnamed protein product, partial [Cladocopium goreaui]
NTWVWLSRSTTGRSRTRVRGNRHFKKVRRANRLIRRVQYLCEYCFRRGIHYAIEQPNSTLLWHYAPLEAMLRRHKARAISIPLGAFGSLSEKRVAIYTTAPYLDQLGCSLDPVRRERLAPLRSSLDLEIVRKFVCSKSGEVKVAGGKDLSKTSEYPVGLGLKVGELLKKHVKVEQPLPEMDLEFHDLDGSDS